ncbi:hypothetical protein D3C77_345530 [compost metagenome]
MLADWERVAGLPDKCAGTLESTVQGRRNALLAKLTATGGQSKAYFIAIAAALGYEITIEEFRPFRAGRSTAGDVLTNGDWMFTWRVRAPEVTVIPFRAGRSAAGEQLRAWGNDTLECKIRQRSPAHTVVLFAYANSSLDLLFTSATYLLKQQSVPFNSLINFTRASTGTYFDAAGVLQTAAADAPRFEFDASGAPLGLLFEQQRTNSYLFNQDLNNAYWGKAAGSMSAAGVVGGMPIFRFTPDTSNVGHLVSRALSMPAGSTVNLSWVAKADGYKRLSVRVAPGGTLVGRVVFDVQDGFIAQNNAGITADIRPVGNGLFRFSVTFPLGAGVNGASANLEVANDINGLTFAGDGVSSVLLSCPQAENDSMSSIIKTEGSAVTRAADLAFVPTGDWLQAGEGTLFAEVAHDVPTIESATAVLGTTSTVGRATLWLLPSARASSHVVTDGGATVFLSTLGPTLSNGQVIKQALAYAKNQFQFSADGVVSPLDAAGDLPTINRLVLGARGVSAQHMQGYIRRIRYYPRRLSESELVALTSS